MIAEVLKTKLEAIHTECEAASSLAVDKLYDDARYDGSRFCVPSFQAAGAVWLRLIAEKETRFIVELARVLRTPGASLSSEGKVEIRSFVDAAFSDASYLDRLQRFTEGVSRKAASYGISFGAAVYRVDLADSAYRVGVMNTTRKARANVLAELELHSHPSAPDSVLALSKWWRYLRAHPWKTVGAVVLLGVAPWLISKVSPPDILSWFRVRQ